MADIFGIDRNFVDSYVDMPYLRALISYREQNPSVRSLLQIIACSLGMKPPQRKVSKKNYGAEGLLNIAGATLEANSKEFNEISSLFDRAKKIEIKDG